MADQIYSSGTPAMMATTQLPAQETQAYYTQGYPTQSYPAAGSTYGYTTAYPSYQIGSETQIPATMMTAETQQTSGGIPASMYYMPAETNFTAQAAPMTSTMSMPYTTTQSYQQVAPSSFATQGAQQNATNFTSLSAGPQYLYPTTTTAMTTNQVPQVQQQTAYTVQQQQPQQAQQTQQYIPYTQSFMAAPTQSFMAPTQSFVAPTQSFVAPTQSFVNSGPYGSAGYPQQMQTQVPIIPKKPKKKCCC